MCQQAFHVCSDCGMMTVGSRTPCPTKPRCHKPMTYVAPLPEGPTSDGCGRCELRRAGHPTYHGPGGSSERGCWRIFWDILKCSLRNHDDDDDDGGGDGDGNDDGEGNDDGDGNEDGHGFGDGGATTSIGKKPPRVLDSCHRHRHHHRRRRRVCMEGPEVSTPKTKLGKRKRDSAAGGKIDLGGSGSSNMRRSSVRLADRVKRTSD